MGNSLYLECNSGISGDMTVAALLDLGASYTVLEKTLKSLHLEGFRTKLSRVKKAGIDCADFEVILENGDVRDHDMEYLHGSSEIHEHSHDHGEHEHHHHTHSHGEHHHHDHDHEEHHHHGERGPKEIIDLIKLCDMTDNAKDIASRIVKIIAEAESKAHSVPFDKVHFHEVGAIDSIVDIVSVAVCLDYLDISEVIIPKLCEGTGTVRCQHGVLPVPVPAVLNIVESHDLALEISDVKGELVTPTGAAIAAAIRTTDKLPKSFKIKLTGMGAGKRTYSRPSILRAMIIEPENDPDILDDFIRRSEHILETPSSEKAKGIDDNYIYKLETNIDDCSGEVLGFCMERLYDAGAKDVYYFPIYMKKNRPAWQLNVICRETDIERLEEVIFRNTTTIGIRRVRMDRTVLLRRLMNVDTEYGEVKVKVCLVGDEERYYPEYESVAEISRNLGAPFSDIYADAVYQAKHKFI